MTAEASADKRHTAQVTMLAALALSVLTGCVMESPPVASFNYSPSMCHCGQPIEFDASSCEPGVDSIASYTWRFSDDSTANGCVVNHVFTSVGEHTVVLTITTDSGKVASRSEVVDIKSGLVVPSVYPTIQAAIDAAEDGDRVVVLPGTYAVALAVQEKRITIQSSDPKDPEVVSATILKPKPDAGHPIVTLAEYTTATVEGFTITGMIGCPNCPTGAIYIRDSSPVIRRNRIASNMEGGILMVESGARILENEFVDNVRSIRGNSGGAISIYGCEHAPTISGNTFSHNTAQSGGAIYVAASCVDLTDDDAMPTLLRNNTFNDNTATEFGGGAVFVEYGAKLALDKPDSNSYRGNEPDDVFYVVPPD